MSHRERKFPACSTVDVNPERGRVQEIVCVCETRAGASRPPAQEGFALFCNEIILFVFTEAPQKETGFRSAGRGSLRSEPRTIPPGVDAAPSRPGHWTPDTERRLKRL